MTSDNAVLCIPCLCFVMSCILRKKVTRRIIVTPEYVKLCAKGTRKVSDNKNGFRKLEIYRKCSVLLFISKLLLFRLNTN